MFKVSRKTLILLSGGIWLMIGCMLLFLGLNFIIASVYSINFNTLHLPVLHFLNYYITSSQYAAALWVFFAIAIGSLKGRFVFAKTVRRSVDRILSLPDPITLGKIYAKSYYLLLLVMVFLGFLMRFTPLDVRGGVDVIVGAALIQGAFLYFHYAWQLHRSQNRA